jgi:hypothetical protein
VKWAKHLHVSLSGYHSWKRNAQRREEERASLTDKVRKLFKDSGGSYGADMRETSRGGIKNVIPSRT